jgi:hypothetical protein
MSLHTSRLTVSSTLGAWALVGAAAAVMAIPGARSIAVAELWLAFGKQPEWMRAADGGSWPRLQRVCDSQPEDESIQTAMATLPPRPPTLEQPETFEEPPTPPEDAEAVTIRRLQDLEARFPASAAIRAHLLRYLLVAKVKLERPEVDQVYGVRPPRVKKFPRRPSSVEALGLFLQAAAQGQQLDPENGFFDTMLAVRDFVQKEDAEALRDLQRAAEKPRWNDYALDDVRNQWRLLQNAYGDRGAPQKARGFEHLLFPHFGPIRNTAALALWHTGRLEKAGAVRGARTVRHAVMQLGMRLLESSPTTIGRHVGLAMFWEGGYSVPLVHPSYPNREAADYALRQRKARYERLLRSHGETVEADWVHAQKERADRIGDQLHIQQALWDQNVPFSHGRWTGWWTLGFLILRQVFLLAALGLAATLWAVRPVPTPTRAHRSSHAGWQALGMAVLVLAQLLITVGRSFGLIWSNIDPELVLRLMLAIGLGCGLAQLLARARARQDGHGRAVNVPSWAGVSLALLITPFVLWMATGSAVVLGTAMTAGLVSIGMLAVAHASGNQQKRAVRYPRWRPELVALIAVLPSAGLLFVAREVLALSGEATLLLTSQSSPYLGLVSADPGRLIPGLIFLPAAILLFAQMLRVAARREAFADGMARGLRRTAPIAVGLLLAIFVVALVPTIRSDRAAVHFYDQAVKDQLSLTPLTR